MFELVVAVWLRLLRFPRDSRKRFRPLSSLNNFDEITGDVLVEKFKTIQKNFNFGNILHKTSLHLQTTLIIFGVILYILV